MEFSPQQNITCTHAHCLGWNLRSMSLYRKRIAKENFPLLSSLAVRKVLSVNWNVKDIDVTLQRQQSQLVVKLVSLKLVGDDDINKSLLREIICFPPIKTNSSTRSHFRFPSTFSSRSLAAASNKNFFILQFSFSLHNFVCQSFWVLLPSSLPSSFFLSTRRLLRDKNFFLKIDICSFSCFSWENSFFSRLSRETAYMRITKILTKIMQSP